MKNDVIAGQFELLADLLEIQSTIRFAFARTGTRLAPFPPPPIPSPTSPLPAQT